MRIRVRDPFDRISRCIHRNSVGRPLVDEEHRLRGEWKERYDSWNVDGLVFRQWYEASEIWWSRS
jgi:hypothetical protein